MDKCGGDILQVTGFSQNAVSSQIENLVASAKAGAIDSLGGIASVGGYESSILMQGQSQGNMAMSGVGGNDNTHADTNVNV